MSKSTYIGTGKSTQRNEEVAKPRTVHRCNTNMGPFDILDMIVLASKLQIKT